PVRVPDPAPPPVLDPPAELGAHDVRLHRGLGRPGLASHLEARPALLVVETGLERRPVDVEDHGLLLLLVTGGLRSHVGWFWKPWARLPSDRGERTPHKRVNGVRRTRHGHDRKCAPPAARLPPRFQHRALRALAKRAPLRSTAR